MKRFLGIRVEFRGSFNAEVFVKDGDEFSKPNKLFHFKLEGRYYHSPDGFEWGYGGSGPADLAYSILRDLGLSDEEAFPLYQDFKWDIIAKLPREGFTLEEAAVRDWLAIHKVIAT